MDRKQTRTCSMRTHTSQTRTLIKTKAAPTTRSRLRSSAKSTRPSSNKSRENWMSSSRSTTTSRSSSLTSWTARATWCTTWRTSCKARSPCWRSSFRPHRLSSARIRTNSTGSWNNAQKRNKQIKNSSLAYRKKRVKLRSF